MPDPVLAPCGLYCGVCLDNIVNHVCHGCGCDCGSCAGAGHHEFCTIARCASGKGFATCAECDDFPCLEMIQFTYHPLAQHHLSAIEVLRRVQRVGEDRVLAELQAYFEDEDTRLQWAYGEAEGEGRWRAYRAWKTALSPEK